MSLSAFIRKRQPGNFATATPATLATQEGQKVRTVASVAGVAVANTETVKTGDGKSWPRWLFHFAERDDLPVTFQSAVDHGAALAYCPDEVAAEPIPERPQRKPAKAEADEITALILAIYGNDTDDDRAEALAAGLADPDGALRCYRTIAKDRGISVMKAEDDRRPCSQCLNLRGRACAIAKPGGLVSANLGYQPETAVLQRCAGYLPNPNDYDQRPGRERWTGLNQQAVNETTVRLQQISTKSFFETNEG